MNVAMFTNTYHPMVGGIEKSIEIFTEQFRVRGHRTLVVTPQFEGATRSDTLIYRVPAIRKAAGSPFSVRLPLLTGVTDRLDVFEPDILHSHQPFMMGDTALRAARKRRVPLVFTHHTLYERYAYLFSSFADKETVTRVAETLPTEYANLCDFVIAPTQGIADLIQKRGVEGPVEAVPTGIDVAFYAGGDRRKFRHKYGIDDDTFVVGHLGRLNPGKNLGFLTDAVIRYLRESKRGIFLLVGEGESTDDIEKKFREQGLSDRLLYVGRQVGLDSADAYAAMDVFAFASHTDTQGLVLAEAMAASVPVVALSAYGARDVIQEGENGHLVPADATDDQFAEVLHKLEQDSERHATMRDKARTSVDHLDRSVCAERMLKIYEQVLENFSAEREAQLTPWEEFVEGVQVEWDLIGEKAAIARTLFPWMNSRD